MNGIISVLTQSLILSIMALGIYITYKILDFPDLSVDGSFTLGASVVAVSLSNGVNPLFATFLTIFVGLISGFITGVLHIKLKISNLLSGILVMGMLYSINLRIMRKSNIPLFSYNHLFNTKISPIILALILVIACKICLDLFLKTNLGYSLKGVGDNPQMIKSLGINIGNISILGLMISNALVSLSGGLMAQFQGFADINMGIGTLVLGIASIIIGLSIFSKLTKLKPTTLIILGSGIYQFTIYLAINFGLSPNDLKLTTGLVIILFLSLANFKNSYSIAFKSKFAQNQTFTLDSINLFKAKN